MEKVSTLKGVPGMLRPFKEYIADMDLKEGSQIVYYGCPGTCTPFVELLSYIRELPEEKKSNGSDSTKEYIPEINKQLKLKLNKEKGNEVKKTEITLNGNSFIFSVKKFGRKKEEGFVLKYEPEVKPADCVAYVMKLNKILHTINRIICATSSAENQKDLLPTALKMTVELMNFDAGAIYFPDRDMGTASMDVYYGLYDLFFESEIDLKSENSNYSGVFRDNKAIYMEQYLGVPHEEDESGVFSMAIIPVTTDEQTIAILSIATSNLHRFSELEKETLEAIGKEIGGFFRLAKLQRELIYANEEANLYLDIMTHDINNANLISQGYLEILEEERVVVNVCDNGTGIPDEQKPNIFRRYYKGKIQSSGKGLGLSIVQMILERYKAEITVNDRVAGDHKKGVCFKIIFPE